METPARPAAGPVKRPANAPNRGGKPQKGAGKASKQPRKKRPITLGGVLFMLLFLAIVALFGLLYFDYGGARDLFIGFFSLEKVTRGQIAELEERGAALDARSGGLDARAAELDAREEGIAQLEAEAKKLNGEAKTREKAIAQREKDFEEKHNEVLALEASFETRKAELDTREAIIKGEEADIAAAAKLFEQMDPEVAAKTFGSGSDPAQIARLLLSMDSQKAAAILENLSRSLRKSVTDELAP